MPDEMTESAPVETPTESEGTETVETEDVAEDSEESTGQKEDSSPESEETPAQDKSGESKNVSDSESRATETAKKQAIELRQLKRQLKQMEQTIQQQRPQEQELRPPVRPKLEDFYSAEDPDAAFQQAMGKFEQENQSYAVERERRETARKSREETQRQQLENDRKAWNKQESEARKRIPEYSGLEKLYNEVQPSPIVDGFLMNKKTMELGVGPDLLWHLSQNPDIADEINQLEPYEAVERLLEIRHTISNQIKGIKPKPPTTKPLTAIKGGGASPNKEVAPWDRMYR